MDPFPLDILFSVVHFRSNLAQCCTPVLAHLVSVCDVWTRGEGHVSETVELCLSTIGREGSVENDFTWLSGAAV